MIKSHRFLGKKLYYYFCYSTYSITDVYIYNDTLKNQFNYL